MPGRLITREALVLSAIPPDDVLRQLHGAFESAGYRTKTTRNSVEANSGSSFMLRLWGTHFAWGQKNVPCGLTATVDSVEQGGSTVRLRAYDRLGFYVDLHQNLAFQEETARGTEQLLAIATETLDQQQRS